MLLRCSAAFALVAHAQQNGDATAVGYPDMSQRGMKFFVRSSAKVMDEAELSRDQIAAALGAEARDLQGNRTLAQMMPVCLDLLESTGL